MVDDSAAFANFECRRCGRCCRVAGYVRLLTSDVERLSQHLRMSLSSFVTRYTRLARDRGGLSLTEQDNHACVFLSSDNRCMVEPAKPLQCRGFPQQWRFPDWADVCAGARERVPPAGTGAVS